MRLVTIILLLCLICLICLIGAAQTDEVIIIHSGVSLPFVFSILTAEANDTFTLPLYDGGTYNFIVDWGDLSSSTITTYDDADNPHTYADAGASSYTITITGLLNGWKFDNAGDADLVRVISQWGCFQPGNTGDAFKGCGGLTVTAIDNMNLSGVADFNEAFQLCSAVTTIPSMDLWNMSGITNLYGFFHSDVLFTQDIIDWDVHEVTNFAYMFYSCAVFNQNIGGWNTSSATSMTYMFYHATTFNQDVSEWDISGVSSFESMFNGATAFNQDLSTWDVSATTDFRSMFSLTAMDQNLAGWDMTAATDITDMFHGCTLSPANYSAILIGWGAQVVQNNLAIDFGSSTYLTAAAAARAHLILSVGEGGHGWTIEDGGEAPS